MKTIQQEANMQEAPAGDTVLGGASCTRERGEAGDGVGCCIPDPETEAMSRLGRAARAGAGLGFLGLAGALSTRALPGEIALWPLALVPTWFGISHLIAGMINYRGCPELGAIPSVMLARRIETPCGPWERFDARFEPR